MSEPILTYLMPVYATASWVALAKSHADGAWMIPVSGFGAAWALYNTVTRKVLDAGFITMGVVAIFAALEARQGGPSTGVCYGQVRQLAGFQS